VETVGSAWNTHSMFHSASFSLRYHRKNHMDVGNKNRVLCNSPSHTSSALSLGNMTLCLWPRPLRHGGDGVGVPCSVLVFVTFIYLGTVSFSFHLPPLTANCIRASMHILLHHWSMSEAALRPHLINTFCIPLHVCIDLHLPPNGMEFPDAFRAFSILSIEFRL
jgi:hypothetical protein